jgi:hypothetical protein
MTDRNKTDKKIDWGETTWKGSRRRQHQEFYALPFSRKLEMIEGMNAFADSILESRRKQGLPYIDPYTHELVPGMARVREGAKESED